MTKTDTQASIYNAAYELFSRHGFRRVSVEDICKKAEISRKTFYCYYDNKISLVKAILDNMLNATSERYLEIMNGRYTFSEKLTEILNLRIDAMMQMSAEFMGDILSAEDSFIKNYFDEKLEQNKGMILNFYRKAQRNGEIRSDISLSAIIHIQNAFIELCKNEAFRARFTDVPAMMRHVTEIYLFGITSPRKTE